MITLLHGDNIEASRLALNRLKQGATGREIRHLDGSRLDKTTLTQALESKSLFGEETLVIVENLFSKIGKKFKLIEELATIIRESSTGMDVVVWEDREVGTSVTKNFGSLARINLFKTPPIIFQILDGIHPDNRTLLMDLLHRALETDSVERIFSMIIRRVRELIMIKDGVTPEGLQSWQAARLTSQARLFTMEKLLTMEKCLLAIDISTKTGTSPFSLAQQLELLFVDL